MTMQAIVLAVRPRQLIVIDLENRQRVIVHTPMAQRFRPGNLVEIQFNGVMTNSIPPQITAERITRLRLDSPDCSPCR